MRRYKTGLVTLLFAGVFLFFFGCSMPGGGDDQQGQNQAAGPVSANEMALETVRVLSDDAVRDIILNELQGSEGEITLAALVEKMEIMGVDGRIRALFNAFVIAAESANNTPDCTGVVIPEMWLYEPEGAYSMADLLVSFPPEGNEKEWDGVKAYTLAGEVVYLDAGCPPDVPVVVVDTYGHFAFY